MLLEILLILFILFFSVTLLGHASWLILAFLFRAISGGATDSPPSRNDAPLPQQDDRFADLRGYRSVVEALFQRGWIPRAQRDQMHDLGRRYAGEVEAEASVPVDESWQAETGPAADDAEVLVAQPAGVAAQATTEAEVDPWSKPEVAADDVAGLANASGRHVSVPRRAASEVLQSFLVAHNIRWGELVAGLLIVVCAVGLVISLWSPLTQTHRLLPSLVFMVGTIAIEAAGLYTLHRWRLRHTSRAVLLIATLLIPLSVVAGIAVARSGQGDVRLGSPSTIGFLLFGAVVYGVAIWRSGVALVHKRNAVWWTMAVAGPTVMLPLLPELARQWGSYAIGAVILASLAVAAAILIPAGTRGLATWRHPRGYPAARNLWWIAGVGSYSLAVLTGFLLSRADGSLAVTVPLVLSLVPAVVAWVGLGLSIWETGRASSSRVTGASVALIGLVLLGALYPVTMGRPSWLLLWAVAVALSAVVVAVRLGTRWLIALAPLAGGMAAALLVPYWLSDSGWQAELSLWRRPLQASAMWTAMVMGVGASAVAAGLQRSKHDVQRFALPMAAASLAWLVFSLLAAFVVGGLGWLMPGEAAWPTAATILLLGGLLAIAVSALQPFLLGTSSDDEVASSWTFWQWLLTGGQAAVLLGITIAFAWSVPERLLAMAAWRTGDAVWYWIAIVGGFALVWQGIARGIGGRGSLGRLLDRIDFRLDDLCGTVAAVGVLACAAVQWGRLLVNGEVAAVIGASTNAAVLFAIGGTLGWLTLANRNSASPWLRAGIDDLRTLALHASWLWVACRLADAGVARLEPNEAFSWMLIGTGSAVLAMFIVCLGVAWWNMMPQRRRPLTSRTRWTRFAQLSNRWSAIVLALAAMRLVHLHGSLPGTDLAAIDRVGMMAVIIWGVLWASGLALAAVVAGREWLGQASAAMFAVSALIVASVSAENGWLAAQTVALLLLTVVLMQRFAARTGFVRWLYRHATVDEDAVGQSGREEEKNVIAWPFTVAALAWFGCAIAAVVCVVAIVLAWGQPVTLSDVVRWSTLALVAVAGGLVAGWGASLRLSWRVSPLHAVGLSAGVLAALFVQSTNSLSGEAWQATMVIWSVVAVTASLVGWRTNDAAHRTTAVALYGVLAWLGWLPRVMSDWTAWISLAAAVLAHAELIGIAWQAAESERKEPAGVAADDFRTRLWPARRVAAASQWLAVVFFVAGFPVLLGRVDATMESEAYLLTAATAWCVLWATVWRLALPARPDRLLPWADAWFAYGSLLPLCFAVAFAFTTRASGDGLFGRDKIAAGLSCLAVVPLLGTTVLRMGRRGQLFAGYSALMAAVAFVASVLPVDVPTLTRVAIAMLGCAAISVFATWMWPMRRVVQEWLVRRGIEWTETRDRVATREWLAGLLTSTLAAIAIALGLALGAGEPLAGWLAIAAVVFCGWSLAAISVGATADRLRTATVLVFCAAVALFAIAQRDGDSYRLLVAMMRLFVAGVFVIPVCLWWAPRMLRLSANAWQSALRTGAASGAAMAAVALASTLWIEFSLRDQVDIMSIEPVLVVGVAGVLVVLGLLSAVLAIWPRAAVVQRVLPDFSDVQRKALIYAAQVIAALAWLHLYLCRATDFMQTFRGYWPYVVMALAFGSAAVTEWARRRGDRVLSQTLRQTALFLPLIPAIGFWFSGHATRAWVFIDGEVSYALALIVGAAFYGALAAMWQRDRLPRLMGIILGNAAVWVVLTQTPGWGFLQHPQLWLIPPAVCVLAAVQWERERLDASMRSAIRYAATLVVYVSSTADMLLQDIGSTLWGPIVLVSLALLGVAAGMVMRVQAFLYLGTFFVLIGVLSMVWHAQRAIDETWPWWVFGMLSGVLLLVGLMAIEKNKTKLKQLSARLASWE